jgi:hypothetical protein
MERTHLVRGLDRLLLNQVRDTEAPLAGDADGDDAMGLTEQPESGSTAGATIKTPLGRAVVTFLLKPPTSDVTELFQPRRMAFLYFGDDTQTGGKGSDDEDDDDEEAGEAALDWSPQDAEDGTVRDIPETLLRSKADCPVPPEAMNAAADKEVCPRCTAPRVQS